MTTEHLGHRDYIGIYDSFASTPYGAGLSQQIRYEKYNLNQLPPDQWVALLGPDVNNLEHMRVTYQLTQAFVRHSQAHQPDLLQSGDAGLLLVAAISHDQGEALVGDISYGDKTAADTARERQQMTKYAAEFTPDASVMLRRYLARARDEVVFDPSSRLGRMFNAIERLGYLRTALRASSTLEQATTSETRSGLRWLIADVLGNQTAALLAYASDYSAVQAYLDHQTPAINRAFTRVTPDDFTFYGAQRLPKLIQFEAAETAWLNRP